MAIINKFAKDGGDSDRRSVSLAEDTSSSRLHEEAALESGVGDSGASRTLLTEKSARFFRLRISIHTSSAWRWCMEAEIKLLLFRRCKLVN